MERMPPPESGKPLSAAEIQNLRAWIAQGGEYSQHWAFLAPQKPALPQVTRANSVRNPIDSFVADRQKSQAFTPAPEADRYTLVRRLYLDLVGLPPTPAEADAFVASQAPDAYERLVDQLLASPQYGERWARRWLDLARYSDTNGYEKDRSRTIWPYRDWVIHALNDDMPFDRFTVEQLAGDMLPHCTEQQRVATGFHRNTMLNEEGGIDPLEFRYYAVVDRVATTGMTWLGLTLGCAQCHSHKYDPISHEDYFCFMALLDNADEPDLRLDESPAAERHRALLSQMQEATERLSTGFRSEPTQDTPIGTAIPLNTTDLQTRFLNWLTQERSKLVDWRVMHPFDVSAELPHLEVLPDGSIYSTGDITKRDIHKLQIRLPDQMFVKQDSPHERLTALRLEVIPDERLPGGGPGRCYYEGRKGEFFLSELTANRDGHPIHFCDASHTYGKTNIGNGSAEAKNVHDGNGSTGWSTAEREGESHQLVVNLQDPIPLDGTLTVELLFERHFAASLGRYRLWGTTAQTAHASPLPTRIESLLQRAPELLTNGELSELRTYFVQIDPELSSTRQPIESMRAQLPEVPTTLVLQERPHHQRRATYLRHRGEYLQPRQLVTPGIPDWLRSNSRQTPTNRLELAEWLVSSDNPLTARVVANRAWEAFFGQALLRSNGDFGTQAPSPTHPDLLDWLASEVVTRNWSMKSLHRLIVTSATYRQSASAGAALWERDPENHFLARGPRFRLEAEAIRDTYLKASGLLCVTIGGPSVYPPQPESVTSLTYGGMAWPTSVGESRYRRSLYTFSKRTAPFAAFASWDAPSGEQCTVQRDRSNSPLQALTLLNDAMFVEFARALASECKGTDEQRATNMFRRVLVRPPQDHEIGRILTYYHAQVQRLQNGKLSADDIITDADAPAEHAAWVLVARGIMNLDEAITR
ncbi:MAG: DUF1549 and DUF1553 domain-containing protein, partial [Planctomycetota bacterium]|nr:DUF1549 and DUF1553 domain-containing protein [Planctomycetota bacterium]